MRVRILFTLTTMLIVGCHPVPERVELTPICESHCAEIVGMVTDQRTGEPVIGASVQVVGTTRGAMTTRDGTYRIIKLIPGTYALRIASVSHVTVEITDVIALPDSVITVDVVMEEKLSELGDVLMIRTSSDTAMTDKETGSEIPDTMATYRYKPYRESYMTDEAYERWYGERGETGGIEGYVTDNKTGRMISWSKITVAGSDSSGQSDCVAWYELIGLTPGIYTIRSSKRGYYDKVISNLEVKPYMNLIVDFPMDSIGGFNEHDSCGSISGCVTDRETGEGVSYPGIVIVGTARLAEYRRDGMYLMEHVPPGSYTIRMTARDYESLLIDSVVVKARDTTVLNGTLIKSKTGSIKGTVTNKAGRLLGRVSLQLLDTEISLTSDSHGDFLISSLKPATYYLKASAIGHVSSDSIAVTVRAFDTTTVKIRLQEQPKSLDGPLDVQGIVDTIKDTLDPITVKGKVEPIDKEKLMKDTCHETPELLYPAILGTITDKETGERIMGVAVSLEGDNVGTVTNSLGRYKIDVTESGCYTIIIDAVKYHRAVVINLEVGTEMVNRFDVALRKLPPEASLTIFGPGLTVDTIDASTK